VPAPSPCSPPATPRSWRFRGEHEGIAREPEELKDILLYHVVDSALHADDLADLMDQQDGMIATLQGEDVMVDLADDATMINQATVTTADIVCTNGVIHAIDSVLMPEGDLDEEEEVAA